MILGIESAIAGGSLALVDRNAKNLAGWVGGESRVLRAEDLIWRVDELLVSIGASKHDLTMITVSSGPGSFTGIRIGLATALGIKHALGLPMFSSSALHSIVTANVTHAPPRQRLFCAVVPMGRGAMCLQSFERCGRTILSLDMATSVPVGDLGRIIDERVDRYFLLHPAIRQPSIARVSKVKENIAEFIATDCLANRSNEAPSFVSKSY